jgi:soluble lytic murein transglycosylase
MVILCLVLSLVVANRLLSERVAKKNNITMRIAEHVKNENDNMEDETAKTISRTIYQESTRYSIDYRLILA